MCRSGLQNHDGGASLTVRPSAEWKADGLSITADYEASVQANLHVHVNPGISGGVGTSVGSRGNSEGRLIGTMKTMLLQDKEDATAPGKVLALRPEFKDQELSAKVTTDGRLKLKILGGWESIRVPAFGVRATLPVPHNVVPSIPLLSDAPHALDFSISEKVPEGMAITLPENSKVPTHLVIQPGEPAGDPLGYVVPFTVQFHAFTPEEAAKRIAAARAVLRREARPEIKMGKIEVLMGGIAFGPNNDIIKAVRNTVEAVKKADKDVEREVARTADNIEDTVGKAGKDVEREVGKFGTNAGREVSKDGKNVEKTIVKAEKDTEAAVSKAGKDLENTGQKAGKWMKKTFGF